MEKNVWKSETKTGKVALEDLFLRSVEINDYEQITKCIENGVNINCFNTECQTALHIAAENGNFKIMKILSKSVRLEVNCINLYQKTPLHISSENRKVKCIKLLLEIGADINATDNMNRTALHNAVIKNDLEITYLLLKFEARPNLLDVFDNTPLQIAVGVHKPNMLLIKLLIQHGANINQNFRQNFPILFNCTMLNYEGSHLKTIEYMMENGANLNILDSISQRNVLHLVAGIGCLQLMCLFISYNKLDLFKRDINKNLVTDVAKMHGHKQMQYILEDFIYKRRVSRKNDK